MLILASLEFTLFSKFGKASRGKISCCVEARADFSGLQWNEVGAGYGFPRRLCKKERVIQATCWILVMRWNPVKVWACHGGWEAGEEEEECIVFGEYGERGGCEGKGKRTDWKENSCPSRFISKWWELCVEQKITGYSWVLLLRQIPRRNAQQIQPSDIFQKIEQTRGTEGLCVLRQRRRHGLRAG